MERVIPIAVVIIMAALGAYLLLGSSVPETSVAPGPPAAGEGPRPIPELHQAPPPREEAPPVPAVPPAAPPLIEEGPFVTPIVHASIMLEFQGQLVHIDPHTSIDYSSYQKADIILITHPHQDHFNQAKIGELSKPSTRIFGPRSVADAAGGMVIEVLQYGEMIEVGPTTIEAVPAYNIQKSFHPRGLNNGYLITMGTKRIFVGGDIECTEEAAECYLAMSPRVAIPYHQNRSDPEAVAALLANSQIEVRVLRLP